MSSGENFICMVIVNPLVVVYDYIDKLRVKLNKKLIS
jgi:hypothetical protein